MGWDASPALLAVPLPRETYARLDPAGQVLSTWGGSQEMSEREASEPFDLPDQIVALRPRLIGFACSLTRDRSSAEDLAQETMARALAAKWRFQPGTNLKAWLFRIMRNTYLNVLRESTTRPRLISLEELAGEPPDSQADTSSLVESDVILRADLRRIGEVYRTLPSAFAIPLYLTAVEELSYAEVAAILDVPIGTVMSRVYRARRRLMSLLAGSEP